MTDSNHVDDQQTIGGSSAPTPDQRADFPSLVAIVLIHLLDLLARLSRVPMVRQEILRFASGVAELLVPPILPADDLNPNGGVSASPQSMDRVEWLRVALKSTAPQAVVIPDRLSFKGAVHLLHDEVREALKTKTPTYVASLFAKAGFPHARGETLGTYMRLVEKSREAALASSQSAVVASADDLVASSESGPRSADHEAESANNDQNVRADQGSPSDLATAASTGQNASTNAGATLPRWPPETLRSRLTQGPQELPEVEWDLVFVETTIEKPVEDRRPPAPTSSVNSGAADRLDQRTISNRRSSADEVGDQGPRLASRKTGLQPNEERPLTLNFESQLDAERAHPAAPARHLTPPPIPASIDGVLRAVIATSDAMVRAQPHSSDGDHGDSED